MAHQPHSVSIKANLEKGDEDSSKVTTISLKRSPNDKPNSKINTSHYPQTMRTPNQDNKGSQE